MPGPCFMHLWIPRPNFVYPRFRRGASPERDPHPPCVHLLEGGRKGRWKTWGPALAELGEPLAWSLWLCRCPPPRHPPPRTGVQSSSLTTGKPVKWFHVLAQHTPCRCWCQHPKPASGEARVWAPRLEATAVGDGAMLSTVADIFLRVFTAVSTSKCTPSLSSKVMAPFLLARLSCFIR